MEDLCCFVVVLWGYCGAVVEGFGGIVRDVVGVETKRKFLTFYAVS